MSVRCFLAVPKSRDALVSVGAAVERGEEGLGRGWGLSARFPVSLQPVRVFALVCSPSLQPFPTGGPTDMDACNMLAHVNVSKFHSNLSPWYREHMFRFQPMVPAAVRRQPPSSTTPQAATHEPDPHDPVVSLQGVDTLQVRCCNRILCMATFGLGVCGGAGH
jgi:hypothetical protein